MPLRRIDDGHASPLDMEFIEQNLVSRLRAARSEILALQRDANVRPGPNTLTHKMLYQDVLPESAKAYSEMNSLDAVRLVSDHDHVMIAGMPAIEAGDLYFEVGAIDDNETLDAGSAAYGMRSGEELELEATVRYHGSGGTIEMTSLDTTVSTETICASSGNSWWELGDILPSTWTHSAQGITLGATAVVQSIQVYLQRSAGITAATVRAAIYPDDGTGKPLFTPDHEKCSGTTDVSAISTTGEWVTIVLAPAPRLGAGRPYHVVLTVEGMAGGGGGYQGIWWYITSSEAGVYADGLWQVYSGAGYNTWLYGDDEIDGYLKLDKLAEQTTSIVTPAAYAGWQEATADVTLRMAHDLWEKSNFADFYLTVPDGMAVNAIRLLDKNSGGEVQWRCDHVRTPHIPTIRSGDAADGHVLTADGSGGAAWEAPGLKIVLGEWSSTSWDGDAKLDASDGTIDLSSVFGLPAGIKAISCRLAIKTAVGGRFGIIAKDSGGVTYGVLARSNVNNTYGDNHGIVQCDANGDVYWLASGDLLEVYLYINAYLL